MAFAAASDGTKLYFEENGKGDPLLLISGQSQDHAFWDGVLTDFSHKFRVIVFDPRGTGNSDKPLDPPYSTRGLALDAIAILDTLGIARAHVYGHSMGGRIAQWVGIDHGNRLGSLVLGASTPGDKHGVPRPAEVNELWTNPPSDPKRAFEALGSLIFSPAWLAAHKDALRMAPLLPEVRRLQMQASDQHDSWDLLPNIASPTLVIHGSDDLMAPVANANLLASRIPGAQVAIIKGGRHGYLVEFQKEASKAVDDFLKKHPL